MSSNEKSNSISSLERMEFCGRQCTPIDGE
jgi:hypothetical protein